MMTQHPAAPAPPTEVRLEHEHDLSKLQALADLSQLTTLSLDSCRVADFSPLTRVPHLTTLTFYNYLLSEPPSSG
jgi:Leucine-rich repeat (LRR) protein